MIRQLFICFRFQVGKGNAEVALALIGYDEELKVCFHCIYPFHNFMLSGSDFYGLIIQDFSTPNEFRFHSPDNLLIYFYVDSYNMQMEIFLSLLTNFWDICIADCNGICIWVNLRLQNH